jgi:hypothetical protein
MAWALTVLLIVVGIRDQFESANDSLSLSELEVQTEKMIWTIGGGVAVLVVTIAAAVAIYLWSISRSEGE